MSAESPPPVWRNRNFNVFWGAQTLSVAGDSFSYVAIPLLVLHATGSVAQMGLLTALASVGSILCGIFAGVIVDRVDRRTLLMACDAARAVLYALIPLAWLFAPQIWLLYLVVPLGGAVAMLFQVTYVTAVPNLVDSRQITEANGRLSASYAAAAVLGPLLAGVVSASFGATAAIAIDAGTFAVSAAALWFVRLRASTGGAEGAAAASWRGLLVGAKFLWRHPVLRTLTVLLTFLIFLTLGLTDIFIYRLKHDLGRADSTVGTVLAIAAIGTITAALLVARARRRLGFGVCWIGSTALAGIGVAGVGLSTSVPWVAAFLTLYTFSLALGAICSLSLRQEVTPDYLLGRVTAAFWTIHNALGPIGAAVLTAAVAWRSVTVVCVAAGLGLLAIAAAGSLTPIRQPHPELLTVPA